MSLQEQYSPVQIALVASLIAIATALSLGTLVFGDPLEEAALTAVPIGLGAGIAFYVFESARRR